MLEMSKNFTVHREWSLCVRGAVQ